MDVPRAPRSPSAHLKPANSTLERASTLLLTGSLSASRSTFADLLTYCR